MKQLITQETLNPKTKFKGIINHLGWIDNTQVGMSRKTNWKLERNTKSRYKRDVFCTYWCWVVEYSTLLYPHIFLKIHSTLFLGFKLFFNDFLQKNIDLVIIYLRITLTQSKGIAFEVSRESNAFGLSDLF
jgi:hypothetical protein